MNKVLLLTLSALVLAACGGGLPRPTQDPSSTGVSVSDPVYPDVSSLLEARIQQDLAGLERPGLAGQAVAPFVYLNVLKLPSSNDTVRAYFKTNHVSPVTCSVDFGDGSSAVNQVVPTVGRIQTSDHTYSSSGTYTVVARCVNGETVVGTQSMSIQISLGTVLDFNTPPPPVDPGYQILASYQQGGYNFAGNAGCSGTGPIFLTSPTRSSSFYGGPPTTSQTILVRQNCFMVMTRQDAGTFSLKRFEMSTHINVVSTFNVIGYLSGGGTVSTQVTTPALRMPMQTVILPSTWTNLTRVEFYNDDGRQDRFLLDNVQAQP